MLLQSIRAELGRLQVHAVNLDVAMNDDQQIALKGSLLQYWKLPSSLDGAWLLAQLQELPDAAGPQSVMNAIAAAHESAIQADSEESKTQLRLFDPQNKLTAIGPALAPRDS